MSLSAQVESRVDELVSRYGLGESAHAGARTLLELWASDELASTTVTMPTHAVEQHLADAWVGLDVDEIQAAGVIADLGTGAGIPALPLAVALPNATMHLVESVRRRTVFLETAIEACGIDSRCQIVVQRAEGWKDGIGLCDVVTSRALSGLDVVLEYCAPLLKVGGVAVAWKGSLDGGEREAGERAAALLGMEIVEERRVEPFPEARDRRLVIARKVAETPAEFPRREGMARKKPLGDR